MAAATPGYPLPVHPEAGGRQTQGFTTPTTDRMPQKVAVLPRRVLPIVFLPGIMGSSLRLSQQRQRELGKKNNIAWRPDRKAEAVVLLNANAARRQAQLDPVETEVDTYEPDKTPAPTGDPKETADQRHDNAEVKFTLPLELGIDTPLLMDDPPTASPRRTKEQKARERGWGEVFFGSYGQLLQRCELRLHTAFRGGKLDDWWKAIVGVEPAAWEAHPGAKMQLLKEDELKQAVLGCWFPVHAMGYNWLKSNRQSGIDLAGRIDKLIAKYQGWGFQCEKVIVVTHSMGGLAARALIHPEMGSLKDKVLGIVHGVMPAIGAGAAYKRMRCGFEDSVFSIVPKVLGNHGDEVTAVLGNSPGGLELLPSQAYGNEWLQVTRKGQMLVSLPQKGDPYEEIYKLRGKWYGLLKEKWLNPAELEPKGEDRLKESFRSLDRAKAFHKAIVDTYHPNSYAHYGADPDRAAWHRVVWDIGSEAYLGPRVDKYQIYDDNRQGRLRVIDPEQQEASAVRKGKGEPQMMDPDQLEALATPPGCSVQLLPAADPGDQTVPLHSADHQLQSGKFKGVFRQTGYEHQDSYKNEAALHSTLYSLVRIIQSMTWSK